MSLSKPIPILSQMPWNIKRDIVNSANNRTKFSVRGCSKEFKSLVDSSRFQFESLILHNNPEEDSISVELILDNDDDDDHNNTREIKFSAHPDGFSKQICHEDGNFEEKVVTGSQNYIDAAVARFCKVMGNPKVSFDELRVASALFIARPFTGDTVKYLSQKSEVLDKIQEFLGSLNYKVSTREFRNNLFHCQEDVLKVFPYLEPGTLKVLKFEYPPFYEADLINGSYRATVDFSAICELQQWKQANVLRLKVNSNLPFEKWAHFSNCTINLKRFTLENVKQLIEAYSRNPNLRFNDCFVEQFRTRTRTEIRNFLSKFTVVRPKKKFNVPIANSTDHIRVEVSSSVSFQRRSETDDDADSSDDSDSSDEE